MKYSCSWKEFACTVICFLHLKALVPNALCSVLFLVDKEAAAKPERDMNVQVIKDGTLNLLLSFVVDFLVCFFFSCFADWNVDFSKSLAEAHWPNPAHARPGRHLPLRPQPLDPLQAGGCDSGGWTVDSVLWRPWAEDNNPENLNKMDL